MNFCNSKIIFKEVTGLRGYGVTGLQKSRIYKEFRTHLVTSSPCHFFKAPE